MRKTIGTTETPDLGQRYKTIAPDHFIFPATLGTDRTHSGVNDDEKMYELSQNIEKLTSTMDQV